MQSENTTVKNDWRKRVEKLKGKVASYTPRLCPERAIIITDSYSRSEKEEPVIRRAKTLRDILAKMSIYILNDELIVGNQASKPLAAPVFPEYAVDWLEEELDTLPERSGDRFLVGEETKKQLRNVFRYWKNKTHHERVYAALPDFVKEAESIGAIWGKHLLNNGDGHLVVDYEKVLRVGFRGIREEAERELQKLDLSNPEDLKKRPFLFSVPIVCEAAAFFARRFARESAMAASRETNPKRKQELEAIARICLRVPDKPARTFHEALQSLWFIHLILQIESNGHSISLGRFDQYMYPFYEKDVKGGRLTKDAALELIEHFWIKLSSVNKIRPWEDTQYLAGYPLFQNLTIGGQLIEGGDATNELSYLCLQATAEVRLIQPSLSVRFHIGCPHEFLMECCRTIRMGFGMPAMFNDEVIIPALLNRGIAKEDAFNYAVVGCVEVGVPGKWAYRCNGMSYFNMLKVLECALNNGKDSRTGKRLCVGNGELDTFSSFDSVIESWRKQLHYYVRCHVVHDGMADLLMEKYLPNPFCSMLVSDCVKRGKTIKEGGAVYDLVSGQQIGFANVANSLAAIKKLVFEDKKITLKELKQALEHNFTGKRSQEIQSILTNEAPKYGNDDDYVDLLGVLAYMDYIKSLIQFRNTRYGRGPKGGGWHPSTSTVTANVPFGLFVGATPDGRRNAEPLAEGISPAQGTDKLGPTAAMNSVTKLPNLLVSGGQLLNMKFSPNLLAGEKGIRNLATLIKTFFIKKGWHVQFNVISVDTLREAQTQPEKYQNLLVRVAGYSAFFASLNRTIQEDIIRRTEHSFI